MLGPFTYFVWLFGTVIEIYLLVVICGRQSFKRYFWISICSAALLAWTLGSFVFVHKYGYASKAFVYYYYYFDALLTVLLYFCVIELYRLVFDELQLARHIRSFSLLLLIATAGLSYLVIQENKDHLTSRFVIELSQNLYFVGVVLTYVLWGAVVKLRETRARLVHLVLSLGIFFSAYAVIYALRNLFPEFALLRSLPPLVGTFLPLAWAYTFTRIPEEARLAPARVAAVHR